MPPRFLDSPPQNPADDPPRRIQWQVDKRIPIASLAALSMQVLIAGLWFGRTETRLEVLEAWVQENQGTDRRLAVIENRLDRIQETLGDIDQRLGLVGSR